MSQNPILLRIPANADYLDIVRTTLYAIASKAGFAYEDIEDMKVALTEACSNAILHAYEDGMENKVDISFLQDEECLQITVRDYGRSYEGEIQADSIRTLHNIPLGEVSVGGLGIFMMQALMDDVQIKSENGTEVVLIKRLSRNEEMV